MDLLARDVFHLTTSIAFGKTVLSISDYKHKRLAAMVPQRVKLLKGGVCVVSSQLAVLATARTWSR